MDSPVKQEILPIIKQEQQAEPKTPEPENEDDVRDNYFNPEKIINCKYCNKQCEPCENPGLLCETCLKYVHMHCLREKINIPRTLVGDLFFTYCCAECHPLGQQDICRGDKLSWLAVVVLVLYHLRERSIGLSNQGFFHWQSDIASCVGNNWDSLFPKTKKKKHWKGTISGTLSQYKSQCVESGSDHLDTAGWWKLMSLEPPEVIIYRNKKKLKLGKKKKVINFEQELVSTDSFSPARSESVSSIDDEKDHLHFPSSSFTQINNQQPSSRPISPVISESNSSVNDDSNYDTEQSKIQTPSMYSRAYVQPTEFLSDNLFDGDEILDLTDHSEFFDELKKEYQPILNFTKSFNGFSSQWSNDSFKRNKIFDEGENDYDDQDEMSSESEVTSQEPQISLFHQNANKTWPWKKTSNSGKIRLKMSKCEENYFLATIKKRQLDSAPLSIRRLCRKLSVRKIKRDSNLPLFDLDNFTLDKNQKIITDKNRIIDRFYNDNLEMIFEQRLQGFMEPHSVLSPHTGRLLKPFIRRDKNCRPLWLRIMEELKFKVNGKNPNWIPEPIGTIDYCYVKPQHIPAMNSLCKQYFWAGVDLTECLQYPDTTCVVLYKKLVIGFAIMIPDIDYNTAYISFVFTRPEWRRAGIGNFMMYHLTQTYMKKDLTLHVSVTNPALVLYQKFGFKVEEFIQEFYDKYMAPGPRESCHAFFLRLSQ